MFTKRIGWAVTTMGMTALAWTAGCSSSGKGTHDGSSPNNDGTPNDGNSAAALPPCLAQACTSPPTCGPSAFCTVPEGSLTLCKGPVTEATIDDMTAAAITFTPPPCATKGEWVTYVAGAGTINPAYTEAFGYSALPDPSGLPAGVLAGSAGGSGGGSGPRAACAVGSTDAVLYDNADLGLQFGNSVPPDGGISSPPLIDASAYTGVQFWLWASASTASAISANLLVQLGDQKETEIFGICNPNAPQGVTMQLGCGRASAAVSGGAAAVAGHSGSLQGADGGNATIAAGWQLIKVPFVNFVTNTYYGGGNETAVDPTTLAFVNFIINNTTAAAVAFNFCVYDLAFYH